MDLLDKYDWIYTKWPHKVNLSNKKVELAAIDTYLGNDAVWEKFQNALEIMVQDTMSCNLKSLTVVIPKIAASLSGGPIKTATIQNLMPPRSVKKEDPIKNEVFEEIFKQWPVNYEFPEKKESAKQAFLNAIEGGKIEEIKSACLCYAAEFSSGFSGFAYPKGLKNFLCDTDALDVWTLRSKARGNLSPEVIEKREYFDAIWGMYPTFSGKDVARVEKECFHIYRRYVNDENLCDFFCAVKKYQEIVKISSPDGDIRYVKKFASFFKEWEAVDCWEEKGKIVFSAFFNKIEKIGRSMGVMDFEPFEKVVHFFAKEKNSILDIIKKTVEVVYKDFLLISVDHSMISEVYSQVKTKCKYSEDRECVTL